MIWRISRLFYDSKTILQEIVQAEDSEIAYVLVSEEGPEHCKTFGVNVLIDQKVVASGTGRTKKAAEQQAAYNSILKLRKVK